MKKVFYLILIGIMFVIPKNAFAEEHSISWRTVWGYTNRWNGGTLSTPSYTMPSPTSYSINGVDYWQYSHSDLPDANKFEYYFGTTQAKFDTGTTYTVSGYVGFFGTFYNASVDKEPLQTFILYTREIGASQDDEYECQYNITNQHGNLQYFYEFTCKDVKLYENTRFGVVATLQNRESNTSLISQKFDFVANDTNSKMDAMVEEQQKTNEKLDGINDTMNDSNIDMDGANSFFGDFSDTDHGGISGVITAPLRFINKLTGMCSPISLDVLGANVELPCGDTLFWNKPEVASFRVIWNVLFGGAMLYLLLSKLFKVIEGLKNPDDSRIEVMKL